MDSKIKCANCGLKIIRSAVNRADMCFECEYSISLVVDYILYSSRSGIK